MMILDVKDQISRRDHGDEENSTHTIRIQEITWFDQPISTYIHSNNKRDHYGKMIIQRYPNISLSIAYFIIANALFPIN